MKIKDKRMKTARSSVMTKMEANGYYPCLCIGTRHPCNYHCKKCIFEAIYCSK